MPKCKQNPYQTLIQTRSLAGQVRGGADIYTDVKGAVCIQVCVGGLNAYRCVGAECVQVLRWETNSLCQMHSEAR